MHVVVITPIPTPYRDPFWDCFAALKDVQLTVVYCSQGRADRPWQFRSNGTDCRRQFPKTHNLFSFRQEGASCYWTPTIRPLLGRLRPDVVLLGGYNHFTMLSAAAYCHRRGIPFLLMCETWRRRQGVTGWMRTAFLKRWLRKSAGALPTGSLAAAWLTSMGVAEDRQCLLPNVPDIDALMTRRRDAAALQREIRNRLRVAQHTRIILFAARMVEKKRPSVVIDAFSRLRNRDSTQLVMLGDGPLLEAARQQSRELQCDECIRFPGFVEPAAVHDWMTIADMFVQPSSETWGVAPVEALACGCPVVLSREIGCHADVVSGPDDGLVLDVVNADNLATAMSALSLRQRDSADSANIPASDWLQQNGHMALAERLGVFLHRVIKDRTCE